MNPVFIIGALGYFTCVEQHTGPTSLRPIQRMKPEGSRIPHSAEQQSLSPVPLCHTGHMYECIVNQKTLQTFLDIEKKIEQKIIYWMGKVCAIISTEGAFSASTKQGGKR